MKMSVGLYVLSFPDDLAHSTFECPDYYGVRFLIEGVTYDVLCNKHMGERINISEGLGCLRDMPFHLGTARFLPDCITTEKIAPIV